MRTVFSFKLLNSKVSVRTRIVAIAVIPVIGFLANSFAFMSGEEMVEKAVVSVSEATMLAEASGGLKAGIAAMRIGLRDFVARPSQESIAAFDAGSRQASQNLETIAHGLSADQRPTLTALNRSIGDAQEIFRSVKAEQEALGFTEMDGVRGRLNQAGLAIEHLINEDLSWVADEDARKLLISLQTMRRFEAEYRLTRVPAIRWKFLDEVTHFNALFDSVDGAPEMREQLTNQIRAYADTFDQWVTGVDRVNMLVELIDTDTQSVVPIADKILDNARERASTASLALAASQARTRQFIIWVGCAAVLIGLAFSWLIGRSITRPLNGLADAMSRLAAGDTSVRIPATHAKRELGMMARTVLVFRDTMLERERLAASQSAANLERERRAEKIAATIARFETSVDKVL
ncbi:MAG TPA: HAMP domain-containing protein, partial [Xanthobacteraceae bacterium]|nr:HAMP domain-containing protein [Xanthobacteraceae bacterium]